jgi:hypothetical protein
MALPFRSLAGIAEVDYVCGAAADPTAVPDLLLEVAHGATAARHFTDLRARLSGDIPAELIEFFFVNTDVGAPELAMAIASAVVAAAPARSALVIRSLLPRTLIDCNRRLDAAARPGGSAPGEVTPGLPIWIRDPADQDLLLQLHADYAALVRAAVAAVCGGGGHALFVHSYAPCSIDVPVDERVVEHLRAAYRPDRLAAFSLRAEVDLITADPAGRELASPALVALVEHELAAAGRQVTRNGTYALHPATLAHEFAAAQPGRCLCFEVRRDLLVPEFVPFVELAVDPAKVREIAGPFARALAVGL